MNDNNLNNNNNSTFVEPVTPVMNNNTEVVPLVQNNIPRSVPPKKGKVVKIVVLVLAFIFIFALGLVLGMSFNAKDKCASDNTTQGGSSGTVNTTANETYTFDKFNPKNIVASAANNEALTSNIKINEIFFNPKYVDYGKTRDAYVYGKNNNSKSVRVEVVISYFDSEGYQIDKYSSSTLVAANQEFVTDLSSVIKDDTAYDSFKITYTASDLKSYETNIDINKYDLTFSDTTSGVVAIAKSNADKAAYVNLSCLYYKNGKVVFADSRSYAMIKPQETQNFTFYAHKLKLNNDYKNLKSIEYDDVKVFIHGAYNSDTINY